MSTVTHLSESSAKGALDPKTRARVVSGVLEVLAVRPPAADQSAADALPAIGVSTEGARAVAS